MGLGISIGRTRGESLASERKRKSEQRKKKKGDLERGVTKDRNVRY